MDALEQVGDRGDLDPLRSSTNAASYKRVEDVL